jgi:FkbM family methyltransferase
MRTRFSRLRQSILNWYTVGVLAAIVIPSRVPPRRGLEGTWLGRFVATVRAFDGSIIRCQLQDAGDWISVYVDGDYEMQIPWPDLRLIVDIGSCVGSFTIWAGRRSPKARLIVVEPNPKVYPCLVDNIERNDLRERVTFVEGALGATSGLGTLEDDLARNTEMRVVPIGLGMGTNIKVFTLEQLFAETMTDHCDLLKMDCEGAEYDILLTAPDSVLRRIRAIVCEYHPMNQRGPAQLVDRLTECGFRVEAGHEAIGIIRARRSS